MDEIPKRLNVEVDGFAKCAKYDVYFKGKQQHDCIVADVDRGLIVRYRRLFGVIAKDRSGRSMTEEVRGKVQIVLKGEAP